MGIARLLMMAGVILFLLGCLIALGDRLPVKLGRLPGDIVIRGKHTVFYMPLMTSLLLSVALSVLFWIFSRKG